MENQQNQILESEVEKHPQFGIPKEQAQVVESQSEVEHPQFVVPQQETVQSQVAEYGEQAQVVESQSEVEHPQFVVPQQETVQSQVAEYGEQAQVVESQSEVEHPQLTEVQHEEITHPQFAPRSAFSQPTQAMSQKQVEEQTQFNQQSQPHQPIVSEKKTKAKKIKTKPEANSGKKKKKLLISAVIAIVATILLIGSGVFYYFYAVVNSNQITAAMMIEKLSTAQKIDGSITTGAITGSSDSNVSTLEMKNWKYIYTKNVENNRHFYLSGRVGEPSNFPKQSNIFALTVRPNMRIEWFVFGEKGSQQLEGDSKRTLEEILTKTNSDMQKNVMELKNFLLNGYIPQTKVEGKKITITLGKDDLEKITKKIEDNVRSDKEKFKSLVKKVQPNTDVENVTESFVSGNLSKMLHDDSFNVSDFKVEAVFEEKSDKEIIGKMKFSLTIENHNSDQTAKTEYKFETETRYTL